MILPEHLAEFEDSNFQKENRELFAPYLLSAYRYHALAVRGRRDVRGSYIFHINMCRWGSYLIFLLINIFSKQPILYLNRPIAFRIEWIEICPKLHFKVGSGFAAFNGLSAYLFTSLLLGNLRYYSTAYYFVELTGDIFVFTFSM